MNRFLDLLTENIFPLQTQHCHGSTIVELPTRDLLVAWFTEDWLTE